MAVGLERKCLRGVIYNLSTFKEGPNKKSVSKRGGGHKMFVKTENYHFIQNFITLFLRFKTEFEKWTSPSVSSRVKGVAQSLTIIQYPPHPCLKPVAVCLYKLQLNVLSNKSVENILSFQTCQEYSLYIIDFHLLVVSLFFFFLIFGD